MRNLRLRQAGAIIFAVGAVATLLTVGIWLVTGAALGLPAYLIAMAMPIGLLLVGIDVVRTARRLMR